jgi:hypothetical protein
VASVGAASIPEAGLVTTTLDFTAVKLPPNTSPCWTPDDPRTAQVMQHDGTRRWVAGSYEGFEALLQALSEGRAE